MPCCRDQPLCYNTTTREKQYYNWQVFGIKQNEEIQCAWSESSTALCFICLIYWCWSSMLRSANFATVALGDDTLTKDLHFVKHIRANSLFPSLYCTAHSLPSQPWFVMSMYRKRKEWMFSVCFSDRTVPLWVLARGAAGMLAGWHHTLAHLPSHLPLPDEWNPQPVLQNLHPTTGNPHADAHTHSLLCSNWMCLSKAGVHSIIRSLLDHVCPIRPHEVISLKILSKGSEAVRFYSSWVSDCFFIWC